MLGPTLHIKLGFTGCSQLLIVIVTFAIICSALYCQCNVLPSNCLSKHSRFPLDTSKLSCCFKQVITYLLIYFLINVNKQYTKLSNGS